MYFHNMCLESIIINTYSMSIACYIHGYKNGGHIFPYISSSSFGGSRSNRVKCLNPLFENLEHNGTPQTHPTRGTIPVVAYVIGSLHHHRMGEISHVWGHDGPWPPSHLINISLDLDPDDLSMVNYPFIPWIFSYQPLQRAIYTSHIIDF